MKYRYSYSRFESDVRRIVAHLQPELARFDDLYGIPRGGLTLAIYLSERLEKPLTLDPRRITRRTLVVDDIADSGLTLRALVCRRKPFKVVTLYRTAYSKIRPDFSCRVKKRGDWIIFPWETTKSSRRDGILKTSHRALYF